MPSIARQITAFTEKEVAEVFKKAKTKINQDGLVILIAPKVENKDFGRILIIIPKRVGTAPQRNLTRRRLKSIFYEEKLYQLEFDCIVIVRREAIELTFDQLKAILMKAFK